MFTECLKDLLPKLDYWKLHDELSDNGQFEEFKQQLIGEINELHIEGLFKAKFNLKKVGILAENHCGPPFSGGLLFRVMTTMTDMSKINK